MLFQLTRHFSFAVSFHKICRLTTYNLLFFKEKNASFILQQVITDSVSCGPYDLQLHNLKISVTK